MSAQTDFLKPIKVEITEENSSKSLMLFNVTDQPSIINPAIIQSIGFYDDRIEIIFNGETISYNVFPYQSPTYCNVSTIAEHYGYDLKYFAKYLPTNEPERA